MNAAVKGRHVGVSEALRTYGRRRLQFAIGPFEPRITRTEACIADVNGPKGWDRQTVVARRIHTRLKSRLRAHTSA
jgi:hypothetical protein